MGRNVKYAKIKEHIIYTRKGDASLFLKGRVGKIIAVSSDGSVTTLAFDGFRLKVPTVAIEKLSQL